MIKIFPSILSANFSCLKDEVRSLDTADGLHFDVMDGHFVPNLTFGNDLITACREHSNLFFDVHLMVQNPDFFVDKFPDADLITFHLEACMHPDRLVQNIKKIGKKVGVALLPTTSHAVLEYLVEQIDVVLVMSVNPGFSGQKFLPYVLSKIEKIRQMIDSRNLKTEIQIDGGINFHNIREVAMAGVDIAVVGSGIFGQAKCRDDYIEIITKLKQKAGK